MSTPTQQCLVLRQRLADAELAYHNLNTGKSARVVVDQNGERVEFAQANRASLYAYIAQVRAEVASACPIDGNTTTTGNFGPPAGFIF